MGEDIASVGRHSESMVESTGYVDVSGTNLHFARHSTTDARRRKKIRTGRQDMAGHHEERLQRFSCSRRRRNRQNPGATEEMFRIIGAYSKRTE